ncbi:MAG: MBL fold metallo-hydrolase [Planctomycetota bacterium]
MKAKFWGTRGSVPVSGPQCVEFGGDTPCVQILLESSRDVVILDSGTGIRSLGLELLGRPDGASKRIHLFLTHAHWDHIQGFPFFGPAFVPGFELEIYCSKDAADFLARQMSPPFFPVGLDAMLATRRFTRLEPEQKVMIGDAVVSWIPLPHPQESTAFRVDENGRSLVLATDTEHPQAGHNPRLVEFATGANVLIYDSQYTPSEYEKKRGWGHSTYVQGTATTAAAGAERLILFSHDPTHDDAAIREIEAEARVLYAATEAARQGMIIDV